MTVCEENKCVGCRACVDICPHKAIEIKDDMFTLNAVIDEDRCVNCGACRQVCQNNIPIVLTNPMHWYQGWARRSELRLKGSSGGVASAIANSFIEQGGYVCSCAFENGQFGFKLVNDLAGASKFKGSKYVKSNPSGIYKEVTKLLRSGKKVLFIGLPCQVAALKLFAGKKDADNLYTVDLICHGSPSQKVLEVYLNQHEYGLNKISDLKFRVKGQFWLSDGYKSITRSGIQDSYLIAFLNRISYTENCYECRFARQERISDLTLGDSWGSKLANEEIEKGVSLILCQTQKGEELLKMSDVQLGDVNIKNAIKNNAQLKHPSIKPKSRDKFVSDIENGENFDLTVLRLLPIKYFKQFVKMILIRLKIIHRRGIHNNCLE